MKVVELYGRVRYAVQIEGLSRREAARQFGIDPQSRASAIWCRKPNRKSVRRHRRRAMPKGALRALE
jgi:hypothetical protein